MNKEEESRLYQTLRDIQKDIASVKEVVPVIEKSLQYQGDDIKDIKTDQKERVKWIKGIVAAIIIYFIKLTVSFFMDKIS